MAAQFSGISDLCHHSTVSPEVPLQTVLDRWTLLNLSHPAIVIKPDTEEDIISSVTFARQNGLCIVVAAGGHGTFVAIDNKTAYLDMKSFKMVDIDEKTRTVRVGAGCLTGELLQELARQGYYTALPNSNAVSVIGCVLGGGSTSLNGLHGFMVDNVLSFTIITAKGERAVVNSSSKGSEQALYHALCGAGHGLGIVTEATLKIYPINDLGLSEGKLWTQTLLFPPSALEEVAAAFAEAQPKDGRLAINLVFMRSPPGTPLAGNPVILLACAFCGPADEGKREVFALFDDVVTRKAITISSAMVALQDINKALDPLNAHGGFKSVASARLKRHSPDALKEAFASWQRFTDAYPDATRSGMTFSNYHTGILEANGNTQEHAEKFLDARDRGSNAMIVPWCNTPESAKAIPTFEQEFLDICQRGDNSPPRTIPNNLRFGKGTNDLFSSGRLEDLRQLKMQLDPEAIFWSPYANLVPS